MRSAIRHQRGLMVRDSALRLPTMKGNVRAAPEIDLLMVRRPTTWVVSNHEADGTGRRLNGD